MKNRTIEDLHDRFVGHKKFARVVDELVGKNYEITNIKEYNEKFKFDVNGIQYEYSKDWKMSSSSYVEYLIKLVNLHKEIKINEKRN